MTAKPALIVLAAALAAGPVRAGFSPSASSESFSRAAQTPLRGLLADPGALSGWDDEDRLINLLEDPSPDIRAQAARALKTYLPLSYRAERALLGLLLEGHETVPVLREAIKSLSWAAVHYDTRDKLRFFCTDETQTPALRALACKALYGAAGDFEIQRVLQDTMVDAQVPLEVRAGAAWALFSDFQGLETKRKLAGEAVDANEPLALRVEAVKSLYRTLGDWQTLHAVDGIARDENEPEALRAAAALCLHAVNSNFQERDLLQKLADADPSPAVRAAAIQALQNGESLDFVRFFHLSSYQGRFVDPLEDQ